MIIKRYTKATYKGEVFFGDWGVLEPGKTYKGDFLIFPDTMYGVGCVLFLSNVGSLSANQRNGIGSSAIGTAHERCV